MKIQLPYMWRSGTDDMSLLLYTTILHIHRYLTLFRSTFRHIYKSHMSAGSMHCPSISLWASLLSLLQTTTARPARATFVNLGAGAVQAVPTSTPQTTPGTTIDNGTLVQTFPIPATNASSKPLKLFSVALAAYLNHRLKQLQYPSW